MDFGRRHGIVIVNDNPYSFIRNDRPLSILQVEGAADMAIEMNSSACASIWRAGALACLCRTPCFVEWVLKVKSNIDSGQPRAIMERRSGGFGRIPEWYSALNAEYGRRARIAEEIMREPGCTVAPGQQCSFLWGRIPDDALGSEAFADARCLTAREYS